MVGLRGVGGDEGQVAYLQTAAVGAPCASINHHSPDMPKQQGWLATAAEVGDPDALSLHARGIMMCVAMYVSWHLSSADLFSFRIRTIRRRRSKGEAHWGGIIHPFGDIGWIDGSLGGWMAGCALPTTQLRWKHDNGLW